MAQEQILNSGDNKPENKLGHIPIPDIGDVLNRTHRATEKIHVIHGVNEEYFPNLAGKEVGQVRKSLRDVFNIPSDAVAIVDGKEVDDLFILGAGQTLTFSKKAGEKGTSPFIL